MGVFLNLIGFVFMEDDGFLGTIGRYIGLVATRVVQL